MPTVAKTLTIPRDPAAVWRQFATQDGLRRWLSPDITIDLRRGGAYRMPGADGETWISGVVLELEPERLFALSWLEEDAGWVHPGRLTITLDGTASATTVTLTHDGFAGIGTPTWERTEAAYERGLERHLILEQLRDSTVAA
ncbi:SRPBCC family protein [Flexivirga sp. B27]